MTISKTLAVLTLASLSLSGPAAAAPAAPPIPRGTEIRVNTGPVVVAWTQQAVEDGRSDVFVRVLSATP